MPLDDAFKKSLRWMMESTSLIDGVSFSTTNRARVSASLHHLAIEHYTAIHTLVEHDLCGSAFALFRPEFEAYLRGAWYHLCASDREIANFLRGSEPPKSGVLIQQLEAREAFTRGELRRMKSKLWRNLCDFTHGGIIQVMARTTRDEIVQSYKPAHVAGLLTSSATLSLLAGVGIASVVKSNDLAIKLREAYRSTYETAA